MWALISTEFPEEPQVSDLLSDLTVGEAQGSGKERKQKICVNFFPCFTKRNVKSLD